MKKDLRGREALKYAPEMMDVAMSPAFDDVRVEDLRKLAELLRDHSGGSLAGVTLESAAAFGGTSRHRFQSAQRALRALVGADHPSTVAVSAALSIFRAATRKGSRHRDDRTRGAILHANRWEPFRDIAAIETIPMNELRALDRFLLFCEAEGRGTEVEDFLAFVSDQDSSMLLRTLRCGIEKLLTLAHPAVAAVEMARSRKEAERYARRKPKEIEHAPRAMVASVPRSALPCEWRRVLDALQEGKRFRGKKLSRKTVKGMTDAARQLIRTARDRKLPDEISLLTIGAYDSALEARGVCTSSRSILFGSLCAFAKRLALTDELVTDIRDLAAHYERTAHRETKRKESRLADLPDLQAIFDRANALLDQAPQVLDRRQRTTLYVDAAALPFLSLIPLRSQDTSLRWGSEILYIGDDDPAEWGLDDQDGRVTYYLDLRTSKTDSDLSGPLAPILTPFLDALILRGQDERMLPDLRDASLRAHAPVFPKSTGKARNLHSLSERWRVHLGTGAIISRTRVHTLLGALGEHGTRAALALCAQRSPRTAKWYQAESLSRRRMLESQEMITGLIEMDDSQAGLLEAL